MVETPSLVIWLALWMSVVLFIVWRQWRTDHSGVGLVLMYMFLLWMFHWLGAAAYLLPDHPEWYATRTLRGFALNAYGVVGFGIGVLVLLPLLGGRPVRDEHMPPSPARSGFSRHVRLYLAVGLACAFLQGTPIGRLPSATALLSGGAALVLPVLLLAIWRSKQTGNKAGFWMVMAIMPLFPIISVVSQGFLGFGIGVLFAVASFIAVFHRPRWQLAAIILVGLYLGLSLFVSYFQVRSDIRDVVWAGESLERRLDVVGRAVEQAEWFSTTDADHLMAIEQRLNQNHLAGAAEEYTPSWQPYAKGATLWMGVQALVPRALWPEKPVQAGSMNLVTTYTGIVFSEGTSVGMGQTLEFYINFGIPGVVVGFALLGCGLGWLDRRAALHLRQSNWSGFTLCYLPGACLLNAGGSTVEITAAMLGATLAALATRAVLQRGERGRSA